MNDQPQIMMAQSQILHNHPQNNVVWPRRPPPFPPDNAVVMFHGGALSHRQIFNASAAAKPPPPPPPPPPARVNWKDFKSDKRKEFRRNNDPIGLVPGHGFNRLKGGRRFHHHKNNFKSRYAPFAPRNTTSFLIRSKRSRADGVKTPYPPTPPILPTPIFSPLSEFWIDMAKEEWGVDGYGSMKGLIRLRSSTSPDDDDEEDDEDAAAYGGGGGGSSDSDVEEERVEVEKRLDHDLSRFEMIYPTSVLENRVDEQDTHIAQLEEENMTLKERMFLMERELEELRTRVQCLETDGIGGICRNRVGDQNDVSSEKSVGNVNDDDDGGDATTFSGKFSVL